MAKPQQVENDLNFSDWKTRDLADKVDEIDRQVESLEQRIDTLRKQKSEVTKIIAKRLGLQPQPRAYAASAESNLPDLDHALGGKRSRITGQQKAQVLKAIPDLLRSTSGGMGAGAIHESVTQMFPAAPITKNSFSVTFLQPLMEEGTIVRVGEKGQARYFHSASKKEINDYKKQVT